MSPPHRQSVARISEELGIHVITLYKCKKTWRLQGEVVPATQKDPEGYRQMITHRLPTPGDEGILKQSAEMEKGMAHRVLTPELIARAGQFAALGLPVQSIARGCTCSERAFYNWLRAAKEGTGSELEMQLLQIIQDGHLQGEMKLVRRLEELAEEGDGRSATWLLSHGPARNSWSDAAATRREVARVIGLVADGILASRISLDAKREVITSIKAKGVGLSEEEP